MVFISGILLLLNALYNFVVWPQFYKRVNADERARDEHGKKTAFFKVHAILISIAMVLALASAVAGVLLFVMLQG